MFALVVPFWDLYGADVDINTRDSNKTEVVNDASYSHFFIFQFFLQHFHFFTLLIAPSSSSLLPPRPSFLLLPPSSSSLFLFCLAGSKSFRIRKKHVSLILIKKRYQRTDGTTDGPTRPLIEIRGRILNSRISVNGQRFPMPPY